MLKISNKTKYITAIFALAHVFCTFLDASAQQKTFTDIELSKLKTNADKMHVKKNFRQTNIREKFKDGDDVPLEYEKEIIERIRPDRYRFITEEKTADGISLTEIINIKGDRYIRENGGEWRRYEGSGNGMGSGSGGGVAEITHTTEKKFTAGEMLDGQKTDHYEIITRYTYTYNPRKIVEKTITEGFWFNADGLFVKTLYETRNETEKTINRGTEFYEYDVNLKIEAPKIKKEK